MEALRADTSAVDLEIATGLHLALGSDEAEVHPGQAPCHPGSAARRLAHQVRCALAGHPGELGSAGHPDVQFLLGRQVTDSLEQFLVAGGIERRHGEQPRPPGGNEYKEMQFCGS